MFFFRVVSVKLYLLAQKLAWGYQNKPKKKSFFVRKIMPVMGNNNDVTIRVYLVQLRLILRVYGLGLLQTNWTAQQWHELFIHVPNGQITTKQRRISLSDESRCFALKHKSCRLKSNKKRLWFRKAQQQNSPSTVNCERRSHKINLLSFIPDANIHFLYRQQVTPKLFHFFKLP